LENFFAIAITILFAVSIVQLQSIETTRAAYTAYPYVPASPNPVGVGQQVLIIFGMAFPRPRNFGKVRKA
jgi:hypothetical protein